MAFVDTGVSEKVGTAWAWGPAELSFVVNSLLTGLLGCHLDFSYSFNRLLLAKKKKDALSYTHKSDECT